MVCNQRAEAIAEISRLLISYREIELWLKKAEQVNGLALIPAINELRYASRQLLVAMAIVHGTNALSPVQHKHVIRRLAIAEQYLFNAEHDIADSITTFYDGVLRVIDRELGPTRVTNLFPEYPFLKQRLIESGDLISEARLNYDKRKENYGRLKQEHLPYLIEKFRCLTDAEVRARHEKAEANRQLVIAQGKVNMLTYLAWFGALGTIVALLTIPLTIYLWMYTRDDICERHPHEFLLALGCAPTHVMGTWVIPNTKMHPARTVILVSPSERGPTASPK